MIALSEKLNHHCIEQGQVKIHKASVDNIPLGSGSMDIITALECIQFWPDTKKCFAEIYRILKPGGKFIVINRYPKENSSWWKTALIKSDTEYRQILNKAGFQKTNTDLHFRKHWICVEAIK